MYCSIEKEITLLVRWTVRQWGPFPDACLHYSHALHMSSHIYLHWSGCKGESMQVIAFNLDISLLYDMTLWVPESVASSRWADSVCGHFQGTKVTLPATPWAKCCFSSKIGGPVFQNLGDQTSSASTKATSSVISSCRQR
jgi:hypothetical protein